MTSMLQCLLALSALLRSARALSACDSEAGQVCPMSMGKEIGECLKDPSKHQITDIDGNPRELEPGEKPLELSAGCKDFIKINDACDAEIQEHCSGNFYHGDTMTCLTTWTSEDKIGAACKSALPAKVDTENEVDEEKEEWRRKRKAARAASIDAINKEKGGGDKKKKRRRSRTSKNDDL